MQLTQLLLQVRDVPSVICEGLEHFKPLVQVFVRRIILNYPKEMCSKDP